MNSNLMKFGTIAMISSAVVACGGGGGGSSTSTTPTSTLSVSGDPTDLTSRGQWGGLVLDGFGIDNAGDSNGELTSEAVPDGQTRYFGGNDNSDDSGTINYVIIAESGFAFRPDQEVQGLTVEAAGSGTNIDYLQVLGSEDDGVEFFGGAASAKHVVVNGADDDALDFDEGYIGSIQYAIVRMGSSNGDRGIEADNAGPSDDATPKSAPHLANITILGNTGKSSKTTVGGLWRRGFGGKLWRSVISDDTVAGTSFDGGCFDVDDQVDDGMKFVDVVVNCSAGTALAADGDTGHSTGSFQSDFVAGTAEGGATVTYDVNTVDPNLDSSTLAVDETATNTPDGATGETFPGTLADAGYYGAVDPSATTPWWQGWTYINSAVDGNLPGSDFHPLEAEITGGTITPNGSPDCTAVNSNFEDAGTVAAFGVDFPVCVISEDIESNTTLSNDYIYVLDGTINVGDGDAQLSGGSPSLNVALTVESGTQIFGRDGTASALVITRGSRILANGTEDQPIIMGAVAAN